MRAGAWSTTSTRALDAAGADGGRRGAARRRRRRRTPGAAPLPLDAAGALARALPARRRRRPRRVRPLRRRGGAPARPGDEGSCTAPTSPTPSRCPAPRVPPGASTPSTRLLAGALIAGLARVGVDAAIARHDGPAGPVCFAGQQGADLRVGDRKLCGSAQVRRDGAVLQHGSILLTRLPFDETDLLRPRPGCAAGDPGRSSATPTVTLEELGAPDRPAGRRRRAGRGFRGNPRPHLRPHRRPPVEPEGGVSTARRG